MLIKMIAMVLIRKKNSISCFTVDIPTTSDIICDNN